MGKILDQFGRLFGLSQSKKPEQRELAVAPIMESHRQYISDGLTPERLASVFKRADAGDISSQAELFSLLEERDSQVLCERDKRRNVITDLDYQLEPAADDSRSKAVAEFVEKYIADCSDWDENLVTLQDAVGKGFSALEIEWDVSEGQALPNSLEPIQQKRFLFTDEKGLLSRVPKLLTDTDALGVDIPAWKTIMHVYGGKSGSPSRSGIYRVVAWMVLFKNYAIKDWVVFCELFGMPLRLGRYDSGATDGEKEALFNAISSLGSDAAGVISKSTEIEFVESAKGSTATDLWKLLAEFCNAEISKAILGQTLTTQVGSSGSFAASKTHNEVRLDLLKADGRAMATTIRSQLIRPIVGFNFGWDTPLPKYKAVYKEDEDLVQKADWLTKLMEKGMPMGLNYLRGQFSIPKPESDEEIILFSSTPVAPESTQVTKLIAKSQGAPEETLPLLVEHGIAEGEMDELIDPVKTLLDEVESLEEFKERLTELFDGLEPLALGQALQKSLALAELAGRFDVTE